MPLPSGIYESKEVIRLVYEQWFGKWRGFAMGSYLDYLVPWVCYLDLLKAGIFLFIDSHLKTPCFQLFSQQSKPFDLGLG